MRGIGIGLAPVIRRLKAHNKVSLGIIEFDPETIDDPELDRFPHIFYVDAVFIAFDADITVRAYNPFLQLPGTVAGFWKRLQQLLFLQQVMLVRDTFCRCMLFVTPSIHP